MCIINPFLLLSEDTPYNQSPQTLWASRESPAFLPFSVGNVLLIHYQSPIGVAHISTAMLRHCHLNGHLMPIVVLPWCTTPTLPLLVWAFLLVDKPPFDSNPSTAPLNCIRWFLLKQLPWQLSSLPVHNRVEGIKEWVPKNEVIPS